MDIEKLYNLLNDKSEDVSKRRELTSYLKKCIKNLQNDSEIRITAYDVAGLLSTNYAQSLDENDGLDEILTRAGELEVMTPIDIKSWSEFCRLIDNL